MIDRGIKNVFPRATDSIKKVTIADNATTIKTMAFDGLNALTAIEFSNKITCIENNAVKES